MSDPIAQRPNLERDDFTQVRWVDLARMREAEYDFAIMKEALQRLAKDDPEAYDAFYQAMRAVVDEAPF